MTIAIDKPLVCPIVIGRDVSLAALDRALVQVQGSHGQTVLISGEAGVGKSRLVAVARGRAEELGFLCLKGQCFESDAALPYAPLVDMLRTRLTGLPPAALSADPSVVAPELRRLVPELATLAPSLPPPPAWREPEQEKRDLFHALAQSVLTQSSDQPILIVMEDLHWSDDTSLEFLLSLTRRARDHPLLQVLTYRNDEIGPGLRHFLAELDRERLAWEVVLEPLTRDGVGAMLRATLGLDRQPRATLLDAFYALTEGNPFFVEEMLKTLAVTGTFSGEHGVGVLQHLDTLHAPRSVRDAVERRLVRLSAHAQRVLTYAAIAGPRFDFSLLRTIADHDETELMQYIKELVAAQFVVEESAERFAFRHALSRQAIAGQLLLRERQALHRTIVEAIEQLHMGSEETHLPDLAYHAFEGGLWEKALSYARRMGEQALAMNAPQAAIEQLTRAVEAARQLGRPPDRTLHRARGQAYEAQGEFERAREDYTCALDSAREAGDEIGQWQGLLDLGFLWQARDYQLAGAFLRKARDLATHMDDPQRLAQSLNRLGNWCANMNQPDRAQDLHQQALAIFRELDDQPGIATTLDLLALATTFGGNRRQAIKYLEEAAARLREVGNRQGLVSVLATLGISRSAFRVNDTLPGPTQRAGQAVRECEEALIIAREIGWRSGEAYALCQLANSLVGEGNYGRALALAHEGLAVASEIEHRGWLTFAHSGLSTIHLDLLAPHDAQWHGEQAHMHAREAGARHLILMTAGSLAWAYLLGGEPARAEAVLRDLMSAESPVATLQQSVVLAARAATCLALGNPDQALRIADRLIEWGGRAGETRVTARLGKLRGDALAALGRTDEAAAALEVARETAREQGSRPVLGQIHVSLGGLLQAQGRRTDAEQAYAAARVVIEEMAATVPDDALRDRFRGEAAARFPALQPPSLRRVTQNRYGGLTARECEVAALIACGHSNRAIADALVISERTVEAHTGHIRDKLGLISRAQVAAWAVQHGVVRDTTR